MGLSNGPGPSCDRWVEEDPGRETITGRLVRSYCAATLTLGSAVGGITATVDPVDSGR